MNVTRFARLADEVHRMPAAGTARSRRLQRLADRHAAAEAAAALQTAAVRAGDRGALAAVLAPAGAIFTGALEGDGGAADDEALRDTLGAAVGSADFLAALPDWILELREVASSRPGTGACTIATALQLWLWTMRHFRSSAGDGATAAAIDELAGLLCPLLAARSLALEIAAAPADGGAEAAFRSDLCHVHAARAAAAAGAGCAELVFGWRRHLRWDAEGCAACFGAEEIDEMEAWMPGIASGARAHGDVIEADGSHPAKAGPCARFDGVDAFVRLRTRLDGCLTGARLARDRAAAALERTVAGASPPPAPASGSV